MDPFSGPGPVGPSRRFVRQFALTGGRAHSVGLDLPIDTLVTLSGAGRERAPMLFAEQADIARRCQAPISIAEISAHLGVHLGIARVLVSDMVSLGLVDVTTRTGDDVDGPDLFTLERLLDDLQAF